MEAGVRCTQAGAGGLPEVLTAVQAGTPIESILWYTLANNIWMHADLVNNDVEYPVYQVWRRMGEKVRAVEAEAEYGR